MSPVQNVTHVTGIYLLNGEARKAGIWEAFYRLIHVTKARDK
jgi:hypothetical protein